MLSKPNPEFSFAGFQFPKFVWDMKKPSKVTGGYYHAPKPNQNKGAFFYLDSDFMPGLRWQYADEVNSGIGHTGWFTNSYCDDKIRGIVMRLPRSKGFLAGWTMGDKMASEVDSYIYEDEISASYAADSMAQHIAELNSEDYDDE